MSSTSSASSSSHSSEVYLSPHSSHSEDEKESGWWGNYGLGGKYWQKPGVVDKTKRTLDTVDETCQTVQGIVKDPTPFFRDMTRGVISGMSTKEGSSSGPSLFDRAYQIITEGVNASSIFVIEELLENSTLYEVDDKDLEIKKESLKSLREAREKGKNIVKTARKIWNRLTEYHILIGGVNLNGKNSSDKELSDTRIAREGRNNDGVSPIYSLVKCQQTWRTLRIQHNLHGETPAEIELPDESLSEEIIVKASEEDDLESLTEKTDECVASFCDKTAHFSTMLALHVLFKHDVEPGYYNKILQKGENIEGRFLRTFATGRTQRFIYKTLYRCIFWLIEPMIRKTIAQVIDQLRTFLSNDGAILQLAAQKIDEMADYYGRIEKARKKYLKSEDPNDPGTFKRYLEQKMTKYGHHNFTEPELISLFSDYVINNFVPKPTVAINERRIPIISPFCEYIVHSLRKAVIKYALKKIGLVPQLLEKGSASAHQAQLGIKRILELKISEIVKMIDQSRSHIAEGSSVDADLHSRRELKAKKDKIISPQLHQTIQQHSRNLLRFIEIEACEGDERKLRNLDNKVGAFFAEIVGAIAELFKWEPFSVERVLTDASTEVMETALLALYEGENKKGSIEKQLQTIFEIFDKSYDYIPPNKKEAIERKFRRECQEVDINLNTLQEELSRSAVGYALELHLKNASGERHKAIKSYIANEQSNYNNFYNNLGKGVIDLNQTIEKAEKRDELIGPKIKNQVDLTITSIEDYLRHISMQLRSPELEGCYSDVMGNQHNLYSEVIQQFNVLHQHMNQIAKSANTIEKEEKKSKHALKRLREFEKLTTDQGARKGRRLFRLWLDKCSPSLKNKFAPRLRNLDRLWGRLEELSSHLPLSATTVQEALVPLKDVENKLYKLAKLTKKYQHLRGMKSPSKKRKMMKEYEQQIKVVYREIMEMEDSGIQKNIIPILQVRDTVELNKILNPPKMETEQPEIFRILDQLKEGRVLSYEKKGPESAKKSIPIPVENEKSVHNREKIQREIAKEMEEIKGGFRAVTFYHAQRITSNLQLLKSEIETVEKEHLPQLAIYNKHFAVKGCISVGEIKLYTNMAPKLIRTIAPEITKGTRTLIESTGEPFHYRQLMLRLLFSDLAHRQYAATA